MSHLHAWNTPQGCNALHIAAMEGRLDSVKVLLRCGIDFSAKDNAGKTALDYVMGDESKRVEKEIKAEIIEMISAAIEKGGGGGS